jgi:hypothetical protein
MRIIKTEDEYRDEQLKLENSYYQNSEEEFYKDLENEYYKNMDIDNEN